MWSNIGTAPRDGTIILVWNGRYVLTVFWEDGEWNTTGDERPLDGEPQPTWWMPLPSPPA